jgi:hypothetical protein
MAQKSLQTFGPIQSGLAEEEGKEKGKVPANPGPPTRPGECPHGRSTWHIQATKSITCEVAAFPSFT